MIEKLSKKINLTPIEFKLILFLFITLIIGLVLKFIFKVNENTQLSVFNYSSVDSIFFSESESYTNNSQIIDKRVDYKQEVFDFNNRSFNKVDKKRLPAENSININIANKQELMNLPGIGEKTAEAIISMREKLKGFRKPEDLLKVKGIGLKKLDNIKKFIFIE